MLQRHQQRAAADLGRGSEQAAQVIVVATLDRHERRIERRAIPQIHRTRGREITRVRVVRALAVLDRLDQLGNYEVDVGVTLAVRMRGHVHGHAVDAGGEIGAVIEIEPAQEVLVRLAAAAVLSDDQPGHDFEQLARAQHGAQVELFRGRDTDRCRSRITAETLQLAGDDDLLQPTRRGGNAAAERERGQQRDEPGSSQVSGRQTHGANCPGRVKAL
jgi:hypothetical protein